MQIDLIIPSYNRSKNIQALHSQVMGYSSKYPLVPHFVVEDTDHETLEQCLDIPCSIIQNSGMSVVSAINTGYRKTSGDLICLVSDKVQFTHGWLDEALELIKKYQVVQLPWIEHNMPEGTFYLINRDYIDTHSGCVDVNNVIYYPGYNHFHADTEFYYTCKDRGVITSAKQTLTCANNLPVNVKNFSKLDEDKALYASRRGLFKGV